VDKRDFAVAFMEPILPLWNLLVAH